MSDENVQYDGPSSDDMLQSFRDVMGAGPEPEPESAPVPPGADEGSETSPAVTEVAIAATPPGADVPADPWGLPVEESTPPVEAPPADPPPAGVPLREPMATTAMSAPVPATTLDTAAPYPPDTGTESFTPPWQQAPHEDPPAPATEARAWSDDPQTEAATEAFVPPWQVAPPDEVPPAPTYPAATDSTVPTPTRQEAPGGDPASVPEPGWQEPVAPGEPAAYVSEPIPHEPPGIFERFSRQILGVVVALVVMGGIFLLMNRGDHIDSLVAGDCFQEPSNTENVTNVETIDCSGAHDYEVFAVLEHPAAEGEPYAGELFLMDWSDEGCYNQFKPYVGTSYETSIYYFEVAIPTEESWDQGDRGTTCVLYQSLDNGLTITASTGSARSSFN